LLVNWQVNNSQVAGKKVHNLTV
jgi:hypothetical protein